MTSIYNICALLRLVSEWMIWSHITYRLVIAYHQGRLATDSSQISCFWRIERDISWGLYSGLTNNAVSSSLGKYPFSTNADIEHKVWLHRLETTNL